MTGDKSKTLLIPELNETYHSKFGAITESRHIFIEHGLDHVKSNDIEIFELGFGTGLNALLSYIYSVEKSIRIKYTAIEKYPLDYIEASLMDYPQQLDTPETDDVLKKMHLAPIQESTHLGDKFELYKYAGDFTKTSFPTSTFDLIYFDAFAPKIQPELWTSEIFLKAAVMLKPGGKLVSYCAQGQFRRNLKAAGLKVERLPGPPGKREMTRATK